ncbi:DNA-binding protein [Pelomonas cellulosilytica]|uniref:DNA-binding protein n=1 Tax=Pelomonas cellulosilytica TaxID=2906762 RepID=A0ABS8XV74_9BURK|nr:DNA-binding protein [Pelomonas sp. P8]MCE4555590.1 DNA-binding protein [Pelomonas sp. P8]
MTTGPNDISWQAQVARVRADFNERGESIADWSRQHGFHPNAVYQVLGGYTQAMRGNAHRIAVALGIKQSPAPKEAKENSMT